MTYFNTNTNMNEIIFKNDLISLELRGDRLDLNDSDGVYIDYYLYVDDQEEDELYEKMEAIVNELRGLDEESLCKYLCSMWDFQEVIHGCGCDKQKMYDLFDKYGEELVVRIGNTALIV